MGTVSCVCKKKSKAMIRKKSARSYNKIPKFKLSLCQYNRITSAPLAEDDFYALKSIYKREFMKEIRNEIDILKTLDHPNIVKAYDIFNCSAKGAIFIVMELCSGGDLYARNPYSEKEAC